MKLNLIFLAGSCLAALFVGFFVIWLNLQKAQVINQNYPTETISHNRD